MRPKSYPTNRGPDRQNLAGQVGRRTMTSAGGQMKNSYRMPAAVLLVVLTLQPLSVHAAPPADQDRTSAARGAISSTNAAVHAIQSREPGRLSHQLAKGLDP